MAATDHTTDHPVAEKKTDLSWLVIPFVVFCLCIPAMLPSFH